MKENQRGFSLPHVLLILVAVAIIGFAGWRVYETQKNADESLRNASNANEVVKQEKKEEPKEEYQPPEGWIQYKHTEFGFSFYHPKNWDSSKFKVKQYNKDEAIRSGYGTPDSVVYASKSDTWVRFLNYGESDENGKPIQKPMESDGNDEFSLKVIERDDYKYPFAYLQLAHAAAARYDIYFTNDSKAYAISLPGINSMAEPEEAWKKTLNEQASSIQDIIKSIRIL